MTRTCLAPSQSLCLGIMTFSLPRPWGCATSRPGRAGRESLAPGWHHRATAPVLGCPLWVSCSVSPIKAEDVLGSSARTLQTSTAGSVLCPAGLSRALQDTWQHFWSPPPGHGHLHPPPPNHDNQNQDCRGHLGGKSGPLFGHGQLRTAGLRRSRAG